MSDEDAKSPRSDDGSGLTPHSTAVSAIGCADAVDWRQRYFEARDALFQFKYPPDPKLLRDVAAEIDCGSDCEHGNTEWDTNAHVCSRSERKEGCAGEKASCLRQFADAIDVCASLQREALSEGASPEAVNPPALRAQVIEECAKVAEERAASALALMDGAKRAGHLDDATQHLLVWTEAAAIASVIRSLSAVSAIDVGEPVAWLDMRHEPADWTKRVVATNPQFVENNGRENFQPLYLHPTTSPKAIGEAPTSAEAVSSSPSPEVGEMVERLKKYRPKNEWGDGEQHTICDEAAVVITALAAENARLRSSPSDDVGELVDLLQKHGNINNDGDYDDLALMRESASLLIALDAERGRLREAIGRSLDGLDMHGPAMVGQVQVFLRSALPASDEK